MVKTTARTCLGGDVEKLELLYIADGSVKWHTALEDSLAVPQKVNSQSYHMIQQFHSEVYTQEK